MEITQGHLTKKGFAILFLQQQIGMARPEGGVYLTWSGLACMVANILLCGAFMKPCAS